MSPQENTAIASLMEETRRFAPLSGFSERAHIKSMEQYQQMYEQSINDPESFWLRAAEILDWFKDVTEAGGYRDYYRDPSRGTLQGGGTAGGLGMDCEFLESLLVPQIMLYGFMGFQPLPDGISVMPRLPRDWPKLEITRIHFRDLVLCLTVTDRSITIRPEGADEAPYNLYLPAGRWRICRRCTGGRWRRAWRAWRPVGRRPGRPACWSACGTSAPSPRAPRPASWWTAWK